MRKRTFLSAIFLLVVFSTSGVIATWKYAENPPQPVNVEAGISLQVFDYPPEQILPGGDTEEAPLGEDHMKVVTLVLDENEKGYGLNINDNVLIHQYLRSHDVIYSNQKVSGGNLKFIIDYGNNTQYLYYCIERVSDTLYYCYTFEEDDLATYGGTNIYMPVFRTSLEKTDIWRATKCYAGYAKTATLQSLGESATSGSSKYAIDVTTWRLNAE